MRTAAEDIKERIKQTPISAIVGNYIPLNKRGANFEAICPFHSDTKPSLKINDNKGIYKCFACGASGDSIKFVQDYKNLEFIDALKDIGSFLGLAVDDLSLKKKVDPKQEYAIRVINAANKLYHKYTDEKKPKVFQEFLQKRKLNPETVKQFEITFAPKLNLLSEYLKTLPKEQQDSAVEAALDIGIIREGKWGHYDFFRERIMFPIWDHYGQIRGYSSRSIREDQIPKYLNSGESLVFDKGNILFGFNFARSHIRSASMALIVEGHMDVISLHQAGFNFTVGAMGTALSSNNVRLLSSLTKNIYLGMDNDEAGFTAATKINKEFFKAKIFPKYVNYAPEKDPDDFLKAYSRIELTKRIEEAPLMIDVIIDKIIPEEIPSSSDQKLTILEQIFDHLSPLEMDLMATEKAIDASKKLKMNGSADTIVAAYERFLKQQKQKDGQYSASLSQIASQNEANAENQDAKPKQMEKIQTKIAKSEAGLIKTLVSHPELLAHASEQQVLDLVTHSKVQHFISWLFELYFEIDESEYLNFMRTEFSKEEADLEIKDIVMSSLFDYQAEKLNQKVATKMINDLVTRLKIERLKEHRKQLSLKHKAANNENESLELLKQIGEVNKELGNLKSI